jgi:MHS family shikimate/dehydroshikimate transporter-like MFS transporter
VVGLWVRSRVSESDEFLEVRRAGATVRYPLAAVLGRHSRAVAVGVAATVVCHAAYIYTSFLPAYATTTLGMPSRWALLALVVASGFAIVVLAVVGRRADRVDRRWYGCTGAALAASAVFPVFASSAAFGPVGLVLGMTVGLSGLMVHYAVLPSLLADQFPVHLRYTGVSACFQLSAVLGGALLPIVASWLVGRSGGQYWPAAVLMVTAGVVTIVGARRCHLSSAGPGTGPAASLRWFRDTCASNSAPRHHDRGPREMRRGQRSGATAAMVSSSSDLNGT